MLLAVSRGRLYGVSLIGAVAALAGKLRGQMNVTLARLLAFYTGILTAAYCVISYKTPWCLLGFWWGMILLAGIGAAVLVNSAARRWAQMGISIVLAIASAQRSRLSSQARYHHLYWRCRRANRRMESV